MQSPSAKQGDGAYIPDVRDIDLSGGRNQEIDCIAAAAERASESLTYDVLMGLCGLAFRIQTLPRMTLCPSTASPRFGYDCLGRLEEIGIVHKQTLESSTTADQLALTVASIDRGVPVPARGSWWWGTVVGYTGGDQGLPQLILHTHEGERDVATTEVPSAIFPVNPRPIEAQQLRDGLELAVVLANTPSFGEYDSGFAAYRAWIALLESPDDALDAQYRAHEPDGGLPNLNGYVHNLLLANRRSAVAYLESVAPLFAGSELRSLEKARERYQNVVEILESGNGPEWTPQGRVEQAGMLQRAMAQEKLGVAAIQSML